MKLKPNQTNFLRFFAADRFIYHLVNYSCLLDAAQCKGRDDPRIKVLR